MGPDKATTVDAVDEVTAIAVDIEGIAVLLSGLVDSRDTPDWIRTGLDFVERSLSTTAGRIRTVAQQIGA